MEIRKKIDRILSYLTRKGLLAFIPDKLFLKLMYYIKIGKTLDLNNPVTYNEKLQWIKLYDRNPLYTELVDKYKVRKFIKERIGEKYLIPLLGVWNTFDEINFDKLPNKFVLKCTHDSGGLVICKNKNNFDYSSAKKKIEMCLKRNFYKLWREWPYKNVPHKIIAEKYMKDETENELKDYKFYCFNGRVKMMVINSDRNSDDSTKGDYFDRDFNVIELTWGFEHAKKLPQKPKQYEKMIEIAEKLSRGLPQIRVDLYCCNNNIFFGEMTFFDGSGFTEIRPDSWDYKLGSYLDLSVSYKK